MEENRHIQIFERLLHIHTIELAILCILSFHSKARFSLRILSYCSETIKPKAWFLTGKVHQILWLVLGMAVISHSVDARVWRGSILEVCLSLVRQEGWFIINNYCTPLISSSSIPTVYLFWDCLLYSSLVSSCDSNLPCVRVCVYYFEICLQLHCVPKICGVIVKVIHIISSLWNFFGSLWGKGNS